MADALCGPSNALSAFQKHSSADRSLQQDRLIGPRNFLPDQGFRSFDHRTGSLDVQFHAFENSVASPSRFDNGFPSNLQPAQPHGFYYPPPIYHSEQQPQQFSQGGWATDFSRLQINEAPVPVQRFRTEAPLVRSANGDWQGEFMRHREGQAMSAVAQGKQAVSMVASQMPMHEASGLMQYQPAFQQSIGEPMQYQGSSIGQTAQQSQQFENGIQEEDWSRAFEDAFKDVMADEQVVPQRDMSQVFQVINVAEPEPEPSTEVNMEQESIRIGSDAIHYTEVKDRTAETDANEANALARVAGELLHNVQGDSSAKFQNSQFLDLMRKIRDRQVEVRDNDFHTTGVETNEPVSVMDQTVQNQPMQAEAEHASQNNQDSFQFPDLNTVYEPDSADVLDFSIDSEQYFAPGGGQATTQIQDLHPGGRLYPARTEPSSVQMSGGILTSSPGTGAAKSA